MTCDCFALLIMCSGGFQLQLEYDSDQEKHSRRKKDHDDSDASNEDDDDDDDDRPKKRGRPRSSVREKLRGFADSELRRFIKSYKKFAHPLTRSASTRLDDILLKYTQPQYLAVQCLEFASNTFCIFNFWKHFFCKSRVLTVMKFIVENLNLF